MAWQWAKQFYPWTLLYSDSVTPNSFPSGGTNKNNCVLGNTPISGIDPSWGGFPRTWQIMGNFKIVVTSIGNNNYRWDIIGDNTVIYTTTWNRLNGQSMYPGFYYDDSTHKAKFVSGTTYTGYNTVYWGDYSSQNDSQQLALYPYVKAAMAVQPGEWVAVNSVSGASGTFEFSKIAQDHINDAGAVTTGDISYLERIMSSTSFKSLAPNTGDSVKIYSGSNPPYQPPNYMIVGNGGTEWQYEMYLAGVVILSGYIPKVADHEYYLSFIKDLNNLKAALSIIDYSENPLSISYNQTSMGATPSTQIYTWLLGSNDEVTPIVNENDPPDGDNPWPGDIIDGLEAPTISAIDTGFTSMFQVTKAQLQSLSDFLWSDAFVDNVKKFFSDPREIIVGIAIMPVAPEVGSSMKIQAGGIDTGIYGNPVTSQYKMLEDIGSVTIKKEAGNFLDYLARITVHLPFCGEHSLDVNDVMGKTLTLSYIFDFLSGSVVACIKVDGSAHYFFGGSCGMQVPSSSEDFGRMYSSILSAGATLGSALATVATGGLTAPLAIGAGAAMAANGMQMSPDVQHTSGSGSINGMLGSQSAYITVERPKAKLAYNQQKFIGQMALISKKISDCNGFIKCLKVHLDGVTAIEDERKEILGYMTNGFRRETGSTLPSVAPVTTGNSTIIFMKCTSESDVMGKTWNNTTLKLEGKIIYNQSILSPEFVINGDVSGYNYAYIDLFKRYYYISNITVNEKNMMTVSFKVDVLQSFKTQIDNCDVILERQENYVSSKMNDPQYWTLQNKDVTPHYFKTSSGGNVKFSRTNNVFILTIAGSNARTP